MAFYFSQHLPKHTGIERHREQLNNPTGLAVISINVTAKFDARAVLTGQSDFGLRTGATEAAANQLIMI